MTLNVEQELRILVAFGSASVLNSGGARPDEVEAILLKEGGHLHQFLLRLREEEFHIRFPWWLKAESTTRRRRKGARSTATPIISNSRRLTKERKAATTSSALLDEL